MKSFIYLLILNIWCVSLIAQERIEKNISKSIVSNFDNFEMLQDSSKNSDIIYYKIRENCKSYQVYKISVYNKLNSKIIKLNTDRKDKVNQVFMNKNSTRLLKIKGNILYDVNYRSTVDTPYAAREVYQHTVQTYLDLLWREKYPLRLYFTTRYSNSGLFRNFSDINLNFNSRDYRNRIIDQVRKNIQQYKLKENDSLKMQENELNVQKKELAALKKWIKSSIVEQKLIEQKEDSIYHHKRVVQPTDTSLIDSKIGFAPSELSKFNDPKRELNKLFTINGLSKSNYVDSLNHILKTKTKSKNDSVNDSSSIVRLKNKIKYIDSLNVSKKDSTAKDSTSTDSVYSKKSRKYLSFKDEYEYKKKRLDSLEKAVKKMDSIFSASKKISERHNDSLSKEINAINNVKQLDDFKNNKGLPDSLIPKNYKTFLAVKSFGIGRCMADYSELSVKNTSITGFNIEYNPHYYYAAAVGYVDYNFRGYIINQPSSTSQYIGLVRFGKGMKEGNNVIFTYYTGKKQLYNSNTSSSSSQLVNVPDFHLMGFTVESKLKINKNNFIVAEFAKSSLPYYSSKDSLVVKKHLLKDAIKIDERSNEAISIKVESFIPKTNTKISGSYQHIGSNFQSFSLFTTGAEQKLWMVKFTQTLWKKQLNLTASIRTMGFTNPLINHSYSSTTVFKSLQVVLKKKKWPMLSAGYFPSSQLLQLAPGKYSENLFYTLNATASHFYKFKGIQMNSTANYTQFYNKAIDSNFVYFNTINYLFSQTAFLGKLTINTSLTVSFNQAYRLYVSDVNMQYEFCEWLSIGAGCKYNKQTKIDNQQWGYSSNVSVKTKKLGNIQISMEKGFMPGSNKQLVANNMGRLTYFKTF